MNIFLTFLKMCKEINGTYYNKNSFEEEKEMLSSETHHKPCDDIQFSVAKF